MFFLDCLHTFSEFSEILVYWTCVGGHLGVTSHPKTPKS
jgi:hypothetical protein